MSRPAAARPRREQLPPGRRRTGLPSQRPNFAEFAEHMGTLTGAPVTQAERVADDGRLTALDSELIVDCQTIVVVSFDSLRTVQAATTAEIEAIRGFLSHPDHLIVVCPHHDIGEADAAADAAALRLWTNLAQRVRSVSERPQA